MRLRKVLFPSVSFFVAQKLLGQYTFLEEVRPSLSGVISPLAVVILNCAPDKGCLVTLSYFSTTRFPLGVLV